jgi:hypothetical protein
MLETISTAIIVYGSSALFVYWFRYACRLLLAAKPARNYAGEVVKANRLVFMAVRESLRYETAPNLARLMASLDRDYVVLTYLLTHVASPAASLERQILRIDYHIMAGWCLLTRGIAPRVARRAVGEMASVVAHFANSLGEQAAIRLCGLR